MRNLPWILGCWPGLGRLWRQGDLLATVWAVSFGLVLQIIVLSGLIWQEWLGPSTTAVLCFLAVGLWIVGQKLFLDGPIWTTTATKAKAEDLFCQAQREYLHGNWQQTQVLVERLLKRDAGDVEASLLLATVYRRFENWEAAERQLDRTTTLRWSSQWQEEINRERQMIREFREELEAAGEEATLDASATVQESANDSRQAA